MSNHNEISSFIWRVCDDVKREFFERMFQDHLVEYYGERMEFYKKMTDKRVYPVYVSGYYEGFRKEN